MAMDGASRAPVSRSWANQALSAKATASLDLSLRRAEHASFTIDDAKIGEGRQRIDQVADRLHAGVALRNGVDEAENRWRGIQHVFRAARRLLGDKRHDFTAIARFPLDIAGPANAANHENGRQRGSEDQKQEDS
jgi:hypothetical protein